MKTVDRLIEANENTVLGNHAVRTTMEKREFLYYATPIITVDYVNKKVIIDDGGFKKRSTTRAINDYLRSDYIQTLVSYRGYTLEDIRE